jgi:pyruvate/2-oxoglutarate/acetoin dehydrogenase E1 component
MKTVLESVKKTGVLVCLEEGSPTGGIGTEVIARTARAGLGLLKKAPVLIAAPECPIPYAKGLETAMIPNPESTAAQIERLLTKG